MPDVDGNNFENLEELEYQLGVLARSITAEDRRHVDPPSDLFLEITGQLANDVPPSMPTHLHHNATDIPTRLRSVPPVESDDIPRPSAMSARSRFEPTTATGPSSRTLWLGLAAAALALLAVSALTLRNFQSDPTGTVVAAASITNADLPVATDSTATAELIDVEGDLRLDVAFENGVLPEGSGNYYEVWLIDDNLEGMISLGVLNAEGRLDVPDTVDPAAFPNVDISVEPLDGNPAHSGQSVLRGQLSF